MKVSESDQTIGYSENTITFNVNIFKKNAINIFQNNHIYAENSTIIGLSGWYNRILSASNNRIAVSLP